MPNEKLNSEDNPSAYKKVYRRYVAKKQGDCDRCPPHGGENARKKQKPDKYKSQRKGK
jgi:hypothetical protein